MKREEPVITRNEEDYLKTMLNMILSGENVATNSLASRLNVAPPSVTSMVKKLMRKGLITYQKYGAIYFTASGEKVAISLTRRHRLWEVFLSQTLNFSWDEVHEVAEELEHVKSEKLMSRLDEFLGFPKFDPHGDRIPSVDLVFSPVKEAALIDISLGQSCQFSAVRDDSSKFLRDLNKIGLKLGMELKILSNGTHTINLKCSNSLEIKIPIDWAKKIYVAKI
ncbi:MAG: metal-dependent transcriptional regulator [Schleiferiaceae bacterium]|nr:metal-dependent transcriptional regulator [Schleiferiaceae bacterium]